MMPIDLTVQGRTGLNQYAGQIDEELHRKLRSRDARTNTFREMAENDAVVGAILFVIDMLLRQVTWDVEPASEDSADVQAGDFLRECMGDTTHSWKDFISEVLSMLVHGWSYFEIVYKKRGGDVRDPKRHSRYTDGRYGWRKLAIRSQESLDRWEFEDDDLAGMWQRPAPSYKEFYIPLEKALHFRTRVRKGNPEGVSVLRTAFRSWYLAKRIQEFESIGIERDLAGLPVMEVPPEILTDGASAEQREMLTELKKLVAEVRRDERMGLIVPSQFDREGNPSQYRFSLLGSGGARQIDTDKIITRYESRIAMTVLADFILLGHEKVGSFSLSSDKTDLFAVAIGAWRDAIAEHLNNHAVPKLFAANGMQLDDLPQIKPGDIEVPDLTDLAEYLSKLTGAGIVIPDEALHRRVRQIAHLPEPQEDEGPL